MPHGFTLFEQGCPGLPALGFRFNASGCEPTGTGFALFRDCGFLCPLGQFAEVTFDGSTTISGPAIRIPSAATKTDFTGIAALQIPSQGGIALVRWNHASLEVIGTVIDTSHTTLDPGDVLRIEAATDNDLLYTVKVNGVIIMQQLIADASLSVLNDCVGFVVVKSLDANNDGSDDVIIPEIPPVTEDADVVIVKSSDTSRASDATLTDDPNLTFVVGANETWTAIAILQFTGASAKFTVTGPADRALGRFHDIAWNYQSSDFDTEDAGITNGQVSAFISFVNGPTPGNVTIQWGQNASNVTATVLKAGSSLTAFRKV